MPNREGPEAPTTESQAGNRTLESGILCSLMWWWGPLAERALPPTHTSEGCLGDTAELDFPPKPKWLDGHRGQSAAVGRVSGTQVLRGLQQVPSPLCLGLPVSLRVSTRLPSLLPGHSGPGTEL